MILNFIQLVCYLAMWYLKFNLNLFLGNWYVILKMKYETYRVIKEHHETGLKCNMNFLIHMAYICQFINETDDASLIQLRKDQPNDQL